MLQKKTLLAGGILVLATIAAYHGSFSAPFFFDDRAQITDNPTIRHLWPLGTVLVPPMNAGVGGRPLLNLSFALNYALGGMNVWGYHAFNLLVHILAGLTLFGIMRRTLKRWSELPSTRSFDGANERVEGNSLHLAFAVALIWLLHPLQTEAVTYVAERAESLMGLFYLLTLYFFIRSVDSGEEGRRGGPASFLGGTRRAASSTFSGIQVSSFKFQIFSFVACICGIATKEVVVTTPIIVLLYDRTFVSGTFREAWKRHGRLYAGYAATWLLLAYLLANLQHRGVGFDMGGSWWAYALTESRVIVRYFCLALWPHPLVFDYGMGVKQPGWGVLPYVVIVLALVATTAWALFGKSRNPKSEFRNLIGFAGAWVFIILAPTSSVMAVAGQPMAEHRMYLPLAAVIAVAVITFRNAKFEFRILMALAITFGILTARRNRAYASEEAIWSDTVAKQPDNERAQNGLGLVLASSGELSAAMARYREAIRLNPDYPDAHQNLAVALETAGRIPEAVVQCEEALRLRPAKPESHYNLGVALQLAGRTSEAIPQFDEALQLRPDYADAEDNLGLALVSIDRVSEAAAHFKNAVRLQPANPELRLNLGSALYNSGDVPGAVFQIKAAIRLRPGYAEAHYNLAVLLGQMGRPRESADEFAEARRLGFRR